MYDLNFDFIFLFIAGKGTKIPLLQNYQHAQEFRVNWTDEATGTPQEQIVSGQKNVDNLTAQNASCNPKVMKLEKNAIPQVGAGRLLRLESSFTLSEAIDKVKQHLGLKHLRVAVANNADLGEKKSQKSKKIKSFKKKSKSEKPEEFTRKKLKN